MNVATGVGFKLWVLLLLNFFMFEANGEGDDKDGAARSIDFDKEIEFGGNLDDEHELSTAKFEFGPASKCGVKYKELPFAVDCQVELLIKLKNDEINSGEGLTSSVLSANVDITDGK